MKSKKTIRKVRNPVTGKETREEKVEKTAEEEYFIDRVRQQIENEKVPEYISKARCVVLNKGNGPAFEQDRIRTLAVSNHEFKI